MLHALNQLLGPLYSALAAVLAFWYGVVPNYAAAIALFTLTVMVVLAPLTVKSTRSMLAMQRLQPEMKKIQAKYKGDRQAMNEELMALYKEHGVSPAGGCLPMFIQLPVFWVLYEIIYGLTHTTKVAGVVHASPRYISHSSLLYQHLVAAHGHMSFLGFDLGRTALNVGGGFAHVLPFWLLIAVCIGLQYLQMRQLTVRNQQQEVTGAAASMQKMTKFMPLIFGVIYISIPAGVNIYFLVSSLVRIGQQELMYRYDPQLKAHMNASKKSSKVIETTERPRGDRQEQATSNGDGQGRGRGVLASLRAAGQELRPSSGSDAGGGRSAGGRNAGGRPPRDAGESPSWSRPRPQGQGTGPRRRSPGSAQVEGIGRRPSGGGSEPAERQRTASTRARAARSPNGNGNGSSAASTRNGSAAKARSPRDGTGARTPAGRDKEKVAALKGAAPDRRRRQAPQAGDKPSGGSGSANRSRSKKPRRPR